MSDLNRTKIERRMKGNVEAQLHLKMLEVCCEENAERLTKEETQAMAEGAKGRGVRWADLTEKEEETRTVTRRRRGQQTR